VFLPPGCAVMQMHQSPSVGQERTFRLQLASALHLRKDGVLRVKEGRLPIILLQAEQVVSPDRHLRQPAA
jgi:hypothetical protein